MTRQRQLFFQGFKLREKVWKKEKVLELRVAGQTGMQRDIATESTDARAGKDGKDVICTARAKNRKVPRPQKKHNFESIRERGGEREVEGNVLF